MEDWPLDLLPLGQGAEQSCGLRGEPVELQLWVSILTAIAPKRPLLARAMAFYKLRDDGIVPVICPTCQNVFARSLKASMPATAMLLCMGLFSIFYQSSS